MGSTCGPDGLQLLHQGGVDVEAPGGVQDHRVKARGVGRFHGGPGNGHRVLARLGGMHRHPDVGPQALELLDGRGPLHVRGHQIRLRPWLLRRFASLAAVVVLPEPCRPTSIRATGGLPLKSSRGDSPPNSVVSSSWTILTTCWAGVRDRMTSSPTARSRMRSIKALVTL